MGSEMCIRDRLLLVGVAVGGIKLGKVLRDRKDEKTAAENKAAEQIQK